MSFVILPNQVLVKFCSLYLVSCTDTVVVVKSVVKIVVIMAIRI